MQVDATASETRKSNHRPTFCAGVKNTKLGDLPGDRLICGSFLPPAAGISPARYIHPASLWWMHASISRTKYRFWPHRNFSTGVRGSHASGTVAIPMLAKMPCFLKIARRRLLCIEGQTTTAFVCGLRARNLESADICWYVVSPNNIVTFSGGTRSRGIDRPSFSNLRCMSATSETGGDIQGLPPMSTIPRVSSRR